MEWVIRGYLLAGLVGHKLIWETLKRGQREAARGQSPVRIRLVKTLKKLLLAGFVVQVLVPASWIPVPAIASQPALFIRGLGLLVFTGGLALAVAGRLQLGTNWTDIEAATVLRDHHVVAHGVYKYLRHPIYIGDLLLIHGLELSLNSSLLVVAICLIPVVLWQAMREERLLVGTLHGYADYCNRTKRFIPYVA